MIKKTLKLLLFITVSFVLLSICLVMPFRWLNPPLTMVMVDRWLESPPGYQTKQNWLSWEDIPLKAAMTVVTAEDQRFPNHNGLDLIEIKNAIKAKWRGKQLRGASTISQQVARNVYLWTGRSWFRKALEVWFTALIELLWGKQRILEVYLNIAEWGVGIFGIQAASLHYFSKSLYKLSPMQMALLASVLPNPIKFNPAKPTSYILAKAKWNIAQQKKLGGVSWISEINKVQNGKY